MVHDDLGDAPNPDGFVEGYGQVWQYIPDPDGGTLVLIYESPGRKMLDSPDNLVFTPHGGIVLCEDDALGADEDIHPLAPGLTNVNRLIGLDPGGEPFELAVNISDDSEFAGVCFSPTGPPCSSTRSAPPRRRSLLAAPTRSGAPGGAVLFGEHGARLRGVSGLIARRGAAGRAAQWETRHAH